MLVATLMLGRPASADTITLAWDPVQQTPQVAGYIVHVGTQPATYDQHFDVGPTTTWQFGAAIAGQQYCFAVTAYVPGPIESLLSNEVCGFSHLPPVLTHPGNQTSTAGQPATLQLQGSDPGGNAVTYSATGLPAGLSLGTTTGFISGTPSAAGTSTVTATVSNGVFTASQVFTWSVVAPDTTAPVVTITGPTSAASYTSATPTLTISGTASDSRGVTQVTWVSNRGGSGTAAGTTAWSAAGIALQSGTNTLTVSARDAAGNVATDVINVTYTAPDTTPPALTITSPTTATSYTAGGASLTLAGTATDGVGVTQVSWVNDRGGSGTATGTTSWSATIAIQTGVNVLTVTARDAAGNTATDVLTVTRGGPFVVVLSSNRTAPQPAGTPITFTIAVSGGSSPYQYRWRLLDGSGWATVQSWGQASTYTWTPATSGSAYRIAIDVKGTDGVVTSAMMSYPIN